MLKKLFGKKEEKFFASLAEDIGDAVESAGDAVTDAVSSVAPALVEKLEAVTPDEADVAAATGEEPPAAEGNATAIATQPSPTTPPPTVSTANYSNPREIIAAALKANSEEMAAAAAKKTEGVFAEEALLMPGNRTSNRRPGASMSTFMDMAKTIKS
ncbi:MAG: hypothetical protein WBB82_15785 [Limnothrix sp.]